MEDYTEPTFNELWDYFEEMTSNWSDDEHNEYLLDDQPATFSGAEPLALSQKLQRTLTTKETEVLLT